jgi:ribosomal protein S18 acetylase RimI-like enzyme
MNGGDVLRGTVGPLRVGAWHGDERVAFVTLTGEGPPPAASAIQWCCERLADRGVKRMITGALSNAEQQGFLAVGFEVHERLHLLVHDLRHVPEPVSEVRLRRARRSDRAAVLDVDHSAFDDFWRLDEAGLSDAIGATPITRFRVAIDPDLAGYAVCGRAGPRGYVQRLAVDPQRQHAGIGGALVVDGLRWMRRHHVGQALVNTQLGNERALSLYEDLGFRRQPDGLAVLVRSLQSEGTAA